MLKKNNNKTIDTILSFITKNWITLIIVFIVIFFLPSVFKYLKSLKDGIDASTNDKNLKNEVDNSSNENSHLSTSKLNDKVKKLKVKYKHISNTKLNEIINSAFNLSYHLGTNATSYSTILGIEYRKDASSMFEDEDSAIKVLKKHPGTFQVLSEYYNSVATRQRDLKKDIHEYISKSDIESLKKHWKKVTKHDYNWL